MNKRLFATLGAIYELREMMKSRFLMKKNISLQQTVSDMDLMHSLMVFARR